MTLVCWDAISLFTVSRKPLNMPTDKGLALPLHAAHESQHSIKMPLRCNCCYVLYISQHKHRQVMLYHDKPGDSAGMDQQCISYAEGFVQLSSLLTQTSLSCATSGCPMHQHLLRVPLQCNCLWRPAAAAPATRSSL